MIPPLPPLFAYVFSCYDYPRGFFQKLETILPETRNMTNADCLASLMGDGRRGVCVTARLPRPRVIIDACFLHAGGLAEVITGVSASDVARRFSYPFGTQQPLPGLPIMSGSKLCK